MYYDIKINEFSDNELLNELIMIAMQLTSKCFEEITKTNSDGN